MNAYKQFLSILLIFAYVTQQKILGATAILIVAPVAPTTKLIAHYESLIVEAYEMTAGNESLIKAKKFIFPFTDALDVQDNKLLNLKVNNMTTRLKKSISESYETIAQAKKLIAQLKSKTDVNDKSMMELLDTVYDVEDLVVESDELKKELLDTISKIKELIAEFEKETKLMAETEELIAESESLLVKVTDELKAKYKKNDVVEALIADYKKWVAENTKSYKAIAQAKTLIAELKKLISELKNAKKMRIKLLINEKKETESLNWDVQAKEITKELIAKTNELKTELLDTIKTFLQKLIYLKS